MVRVQNFINGDFVDPFDPAWLERKNPFTGEPMAEVASSDTMDVVRAIQAANKAWATWQKVEAQARASHLKAIAEKIRLTSQSLAEIYSRETGVPINFTENSGRNAAAVFDYYADLILNPVDDVLNTENRSYFSNRLPIGVVSIITPWVDALMALSTRIAPALAAGNVVIAKPSSFAAQTASALADIAKSAGLPSGVLNFVQGRGAQAGRAIVAHPGLSTISFAGRIETAREIQREASESLKRTQFSLSGCNSTLVFAENDLEKTVAQVAALSFSSATPAHLRPSRIFVQDPIYKPFLELLKSEKEKIRAGDPLDLSTRLGPPSPKPEDRARFENAVKQAVGERGKLLFGSVEELTPCAVFDLTLCSTLQQEEVIGPFAMISSFKYQHDAVKHANTSPFGQVAYVFNSNQEKALKIAQKIEAGRVFINPLNLLFDPHVSFGGIKQSGLGREGGIESLNFFSRQTRIAQDIPR